jgi:sec-independent protein translocase protein TatB
MFDIAFSELVIIGIVALVVIGPERLPKVARTAGHLVGRLQRYVAGVKADIAREMELEELRKFKSEMETTARSVETSIQQEVSLVEHEVRAPENEAAAMETGAAGSRMPSAAAEHVPDLGEPPASHTPDPKPSPQMELALNADQTPGQHGQ